MSSRKGINAFDPDPKCGTCRLGYGEHSCNRGGNAS